MWDIPRDKRLCFFRNSKKKKKRRGDLLIKTDLLQRHSNQMQCVQHCLDPVSEKPIVKEIFMRQSGKFACLLFDDTKTFLFIL